MARGIPQNNAGPEKTDASEDTLHHPADRVRVGDKMAIDCSEDESGGRGGAKRDQRVSPKTGGFPVQLAI